MSINQEQIARYQQSSVEASLALIGVALDSAERLFSLNLAVTRALLEQQAQHSRDIFAVRQPQELLSLQAAYFAPLLGHGLGYVQNTCEIVVQAGNETEKIVEGHFAVLRKSVGGLVERFERSSPGGIGSAVSALTSAVGLFNRVFELFSTTLRRAVSSPPAREPWLADHPDSEGKAPPLLIEHKQAA
jgi:phasin family protein